MTAYGEFRTGFDKDPGDQRLIFYGLRYIVDTYVARRWTEHDLHVMEAFLETHNAGFTPYPYAKDLLAKIVKECGGYFPVRIEALEEGTVVYPHVPVYVISAKDEYAGLVTYLETLLTMVWVCRERPSSVLVSIDGGNLVPALSRPHRGRL